MKEIWRYRANNILHCDLDKRPVGLIAPPFIISFLATGNWLKIKLDDSAFFLTQSYITEICYFEYLLSFGLQKKKHFSPKFRAIWNLIKFLGPTLDFCSEKIHLFAPIHMKSWPKSKLGQVGSRFEHYSDSLI